MMSKEIIKTNLKLSDKISLKYNDRDVDMSLTDFKTFLDANLEPSNALLTSNEPLKYKALLSQNAPIASTNSGTMLAGQIWELSGAANPSDYSFFDGLELISGTLYAIGSKYRASSDTPFTLSASAIKYNGSPYVVSTDVNGDLNPFINTTGGILTYGYVTGNYPLISSGLFIKEKTTYSIGQPDNHNPFAMIWSNINTINITTGSDNLLYYTPISIKVYP